MPIKAESPFVLSLQEGDSVFEGILRYAQFINLQSALFTGIGALTDTTLGFYHRETQLHTKRLLNGSYELVSLTGNVSFVGKERFIHIHAALGDSDFNVYGGHVINAFASASTEIAITPLPYQIQRKAHPELDIKVICPFQINQAFI